MQAKASRSRSSGYTHRRGAAQRARCRFRRTAPATEMNVPAPLPAGAATRRHAPYRGGCATGTGWAKLLAFSKALPGLIDRVCPRGKTRGGYEPGLPEQPATRSTAAQIGTCRAPLRGFPTAPPVALRSGDTLETTSMRRGGWARADRRRERPRRQHPGVRRWRRTWAPAAPARARRAGPVRRCRWQAPGGRLPATPPA